MRHLAFLWVLVATACKEEAPPSPKPDASPSVREVPLTSPSPPAIEAFKRGRDLYEDARPVEAAAELRRAVELDPRFALAHAWLGLALGGDEARRETDLAAGLTAGLPEAERVDVERMVAEERGDLARGRALRKRLVELAPDDWRAQEELGLQAFNDERPADAINPLKRAIALNPTAGTAHNVLGYAYLYLGDYDGAIAAFKRYAELKPAEPNPEDSLGEALLGAGRFEEAEAAFRRAVAKSPAFWFAWVGVADARFFAGDAAHWREALARAKEAAVRPYDKGEAQEAIAWSWLTEGKLADAMKALDVLQREAEAQKVEWWVVVAEIDRAIFLSENGQSAEALKRLAAGDEAAARAHLSGGLSANARRMLLYWRVWIESRLGKAEAQKTLAAVEEEVKRMPPSGALASLGPFARGAVALGKGDAKGAVAQFEGCVAEDWFCRYQLVNALAQAGDKAGSSAARAKLAKANGRHPLYVYVRTRAIASK